MMLAGLAVWLASACGSELVQGQNPSIATYPRAQISFSQIAEGNEERQDLAITNEGDATLQLNSILWEGAAALSLDFPDGAPEGVRLDPGEVYTLVAIYRPTAAQPSGAGDIVIASNDPDGNRGMSAWSELLRVQTVFFCDQI